jgi:protein tyrosine/serine phosphatase
MIYRFKRVTKDLYRGSAPSPMDLAHLKEKHNIKKIVSLDEEAGHRIAKTAKLLGIHQIIIPINWQRPSLFNLLKFNLKKLLLQGGPTFVHCAAGKDRTGLAVALVECKYLGKTPEEAIAEAKSMGMGFGIDPNITYLYEQIIKSCKKDKDTNDADIVSNEREYISDNRDTYLDEGHQGSFSPYLSETRQYPYDSVYRSIDDQSQTRQNYKSLKNKLKEDDAIPQVGIYNNDAGIHGIGPVENAGGFIYD